MNFNFESCLNEGLKNMKSLFYTFIILLHIYF